MRMKYWWLSPYISFFENIDEKVLRSKQGKKQIDHFFKDCSFSIAIPSHYLDYYQKIKNYPIEQLSDCGLQLSFAYQIYQGKVDPSYFKKILLNQQLVTLLKQMQKIPNTYLPSSDYNIEETLEEITHLKELDTSMEKVKNNNVAACYTCRNIFYTDAIYQRNKQKKCLCPYCNHDTLYFDNDYIPMDTNFLYFAYLYYQNEIPFNKLLPLLKEKIHFSSKEKNTFTFEPEEPIGTINFLKQQVYLPKSWYQHMPSGKEEDYLRIALLHLLSEADENRTAILRLKFDLSQDKEVIPIIAMTLYSSILYYFLQNYFTNIQKIEIVVSQETQPLYESILQTLLKFKKS